MQDPTTPSSPEEQENSGLDATNDEFDEGLDPSEDAPDDDGKAPESAQEAAGEAQEAKEGVEEPPSAPAPQEGTQGGAKVLQLGVPLGSNKLEGQGAPDYAYEIERIITDRGSPGTAKSYAGQLRRFLLWCSARGLDVKTMPMDTADTYLREVYVNPVMRSGPSSALRSCFEIASVNGWDIATQVVSKPSRSPAKKEPTVRPSRGVKGREDAESARTDTALFGTPPPAAGSAVQPLATPASAAVPRATPVSATRKPGQSAVPSLGGRIRLHKRIDGTEGIPGAAVGALVLVGDYQSSDLEGEGRIENFIVNNIRPIYGPFYGGRPTVYLVDRLDNIGNPIPGATVQVPIMPEATPRNAAPGVAPQAPPAAAAAAPAAPAVASGITGDRLLDFVISEQRRREEEANKRIEEIRQQATKQGMDPTVLMLLLDRVKPEPIDPAKIVAEAKRQGFLKPPPPPREERPEPPPPPMPGPLGGFDPSMLAPPPPPAPSASEEALMLMLKQQGDMMTGLMQRILQQQPTPAQPQQSLADIIALAKALAPPPPQPSPENEMSKMVMSEMIKRALQPPERPKTMADVLAEFRELNEARDLLGAGPEDKPMSVGEVITAAIENAPAIGQAVASVLSAIPRAPTLQTGQRALPAAGTPTPPVQKTPAAPIPETSKQAFIHLRDATDEQEIVNDVFAILTGYVESGAEPWPLAATKLIEALKKCDSKLDVQTFVGNLFTWSGAKALRTEENTTRITTVLHKHYSTIYAQIAEGQHKVLADAPAPSENEEPAPEAAAEPTADDVVAATAV